MRAKYLLLHDLVVTEIPAAKFKNKLVLPKMKNQLAVLIEVIYETENRKPNSIVRITFDQISFDKEGIYDVGESTLSKEFRVKLQYAIIVNESKKPLPIPIAPAIPNKEQLLAIKEYLNKKYPMLLINSPRAFEETVLYYKAIHQNEIQQMKDSHK